MTKKESDLLVDENEEPDAKRPQPKRFHFGGTDGRRSYYWYSGGHSGTDL